MDTNIETNVETNRTPAIVINGFNLWPGLKVNSEKVDNRRERQYGRSLSISADITMEKTLDDWEKSGKFPSTLIGLAATKAFSELEFPKEVEWSAGTALNPGCACVLYSSYGGPYFGHLVFHLFVRSQKPSLIPSEEECMVLLGGPERIWEVVVESFCSGFEKQKEKEDHKERVQQAEAVLGHLRERVINKAKEVCRFEARMAALMAELETEAQVQVSKALRKLEKDPRWSDSKEPIDERILKAVRKKLPSNVKERNPFLLPTNAFKPDEVE